VQVFPEEEKKKNKGGYTVPQETDLTAPPQEHLPYPKTFLTLT